MNIPSDNDMLEFPSDRIELQLLRNVLLHWKPILICALLFAAVGWLLNFILPVRYTAHMIVAPKSSSMLEDVGAAGSLSKQVGALGTLARLQGRTGDTMYDQYATMLHSQDVAEILLRDHATIATIFDLTWHEDTKQFDMPHNIPFLVIQGIKIIIGARAWHQPDTADVIYYLNKLISYDLDRSTGFATLSYSNKDAAFSRSFLLKIHSIADGVLRQRLLTMTKHRVDYLNSQLQTTTFSENRTTLMDLLLNESKTIMIARADATFAVDIIDSPVVPDKPSSPIPVMNIILGFLFGAIVSGGLFAVGGARLRERWDALFGQVRGRRSARRLEVMDPNSN